MNVYMYFVLLVFGAVMCVEGQAIVTMKQYEFFNSCWGNYGTVLANYYRVKAKEQCGAKCTSMPTCTSFLFFNLTSWCQLNSEQFDTRNTTGCYFLVDYGQITTRDPIPLTPSPPPAQAVQCEGACTLEVNGFRLCDGLGSGQCDPMQGRLEVLYNNEWGSICDDGWLVGSTTAQLNVDVACRMFGYTNGGESRDMAYYGLSSGSIWLDDVICSGNETSLLECSNLGWGSHNCIHEEDQGIFCY